MKTQEYEISHLWGGWTKYRVTSPSQCRSNTDRLALDALINDVPDEKCVCMGQVVVERL